MDGQSLAIYVIPACIRLVDDGLLQKSAGAHFSRLFTRINLRCGTALLITWTSGNKHTYSVSKPVVRTCCQSNFCSASNAVALYYTASDMPTPNSVRNVSIRTGGCAIATAAKAAVRSREPGVQAGARGAFGRRARAEATAAAARLWEVSRYNTAARGIVAPHCSRAAFHDGRTD